MRVFPAEPDHRARPGSGIEAAGACAPAVPRPGPGDPHAGPRPSRPTLRALATGLLLLLVLGCGTDNSGDPAPESLQDRVLRTAALDALADEPYLFPANDEPDGPTVYLPLRRWDMVFVGSVQDETEVPEFRLMTSRLIPGKFDHTLVYMGKDAEGFAYMAELNVSEVRLDDNGGAVIDGGLWLLCVGTDRGEQVHESGARVLDRSYYAVRWAKTFREDVRAEILAHEAELVARIQQDMLDGFPYQLEFDAQLAIELAEGGFTLETQLVLVDDGLENGAGCSDYWVNLLEEYAGVCFKGARMSASELLDYFRNDPEGQAAYIPADLNPLGDEPLEISDALDMGVELTNDVPHRFVCDGTEESGLVVPVRVAESDVLVDITPEASQ